MVDKFNGTMLSLGPELSNPAEVVGEEVCSSIHLVRAPVSFRFAESGDDDKTTRYKIIVSAITMSSSV